jgi:hypothetical protein
MFLLVLDSQEHPFSERHFLGSRTPKPSLLWIEPTLTGSLPGPQTFASYVSPRELALP